MKIYLIYNHDTLKGAVKAPLGKYTSAEIIKAYLNSNGITPRSSDTYWLEQMSVVIME